MSCLTLSWATLKVIILLLKIASAVGARLLLTYKIARLRWFSRTGLNVGSWASILWLNLLCEIFFARIVFFYSQKSLWFTLISRSLLLTISHWLAILISCVRTCSFSLSTSSSCVSCSCYTCWTLLISNCIWHWLLLSRSSKSTIRLRGITSTIHSSTLSCSTQFWFLAILIWNIWACRNWMISRLPIHLSFYAASSCLITLRITRLHQPTRSLWFTRLWSWLFCRSTSLISSNLTMIYNSPVLVIPRAINDICLWILSSIVNIVNIFFQCICYLGLVLLSFRAMISMGLRVKIWIVHLTRAYSMSLSRGTLAITRSLVWALKNLIRWALSRILLVDRALLFLRVIRMIIRWMRLVSVVTTLHPTVSAVICCSTIVSCWAIPAFILFILVIDALGINSWSFFDFTGG